MPTQRPRGMQEWNPRQDARDLIRDIWEVLNTYREQLPLTCRQIYYRLVAEFGYEKDEKWCSNVLYEALNKARREPRDVP
ncbi:hypothetical protein OAS39_10550 [Pirellulales bacterium]|nr:hypothetical protein [Pirellulales bacterium]